MSSKDNTPEIDLSLADLIPDDDADRIMNLWYDFDREHPFTDLDTELGYGELKPASAPLPSASSESETRR